ncbi:MAG: hypothetical protein AcusKO_45770 [Acuticoccus sp.]
MPTVENSRFSVVENDPAGLVLGKIVASDPDGDALTLEIIENFDFDGDTLPAFGIDASGMLYNIVDSDDIDFETRPYLELAVMATDPYGASDVGFVSVDVFDWPEAPTIDDAVFSIAENAVAGVVIGQLSASDPDGGPARLLSGGQPGVLDADDDGCAGDRDLLRRYRVGARRRRARLRDDAADHLPGPGGRQLGARRHRRCHHRNQRRQRGAGF